MKKRADFHRHLKRAAWILRGRLFLRRKETTENNNATACCKNADDDENYIGSGEDSSDGIICALG